MPNEMGGEIKNAEGLDDGQDMIKNGDRMTSRYPTQSCCIVVVARLTIICATVKKQTSGNQTYDMISLIFQIIINNNPHKLQKMKPCCRPATEKNATNKLIGAIRLHRQQQFVVKKI